MKEVAVNQALFFIKPERVERRSEIVEVIRVRDLEIQFVHPIVMSEAILQALYGDKPKEIYLKLQDQMVGKVCFVGVVFSYYGNGLVERLMEVCGKETAPSSCHPSSIRHRFGDHRLGFHHLNAIHRPKNEEEARRDFQAFGLALSS